MAVVLTDVSKPDVSKFVLSIFFIVWLTKSTEENTRRLIVVPFFWWTRNDNGIFVLLLPLGYFNWGRRLQVLALWIVWFDRSVNSWSFGLTLLFFIYRGENATTLSLFFIVWIHFSNDLVLFSFAGLLWVITGSEFSYFFFVPLVWLYYDSSQFTLVLVPFFIMHRTLSSLYLAVVPLFYAAITSKANRFYSILYLLWWWKWNGTWSLCCIDCFWANE